MGDRIAVLNKGVLQQVGTPRDLYEHPQNEFVAGFIGSPAMNLGTFTVDGSVASLGEARVNLPENVVKQLDSREVVLGFRPEALEVDPNGSIPLQVEFVEELGSDSYLYGQLVGGGNLSSGTETNPDADTSNNIVVRTAPHAAPRPGETVRFSIKNGMLHAFSASSGERIGD